MTPPEQDLLDQVFPIRTVRDEAGTLTIGGAGVRGVGGGVRHPALHLRRGDAARGLPGLYPRAGGQLSQRAGALRRQGLRRSHAVAGGGLRGPGDGRRLLGRGARGAGRRHAAGARGAARQQQAAARDRPGAGAWRRAHRRRRAGGDRDHRRAGAAARPRRRRCSCGSRRASRRTRTSTSAPAPWTASSGSGSTPAPPRRPWRGRCAHRISTSWGCTPTSGPRSSTPSPMATRSTSRSTLPSACAPPTDSTCAT